MSELIENVPGGVLVTQKDHYCIEYTFYTSENFAERYGVSKKYWRGEHTAQSKKQFLQKAKNLL